jgi:hypothetical protein
MERWFPMEVKLRNSSTSAIVDDCFREEVSCQGWYLTTLGYVRTTAEPRVWLHRLILGDKEGFFVDHIDGNKLDNRECNLRHVDRSQSQCNRRTPKHNKTGVAGVFASRHKWGATIAVSRKQIWLGTFSTFGEAVAARVSAVAKYHGEFARKVG